MSKYSYPGKKWGDIKNELYTPEEIEAGNIRVEIINAIIENRKKQNLSQNQLSEKCKVPQPVITRLEKGTTNPQIDTISKILFSLGKTLKVVPIEKVRKRA